MMIDKQIEEVENRIKNAKSWKCRNDLMKYKRRLLKERKRNEKSRIDERIDKSL